MATVPVRNQQRGTMKHFHSLALAALLLLVSSPAPAQDAVPLATGEWPPYTSENAPEQGALTAVVRGILLRMGAEPGIRFYPWKRCYELVLRGEIWAAFPYSRTEERAKQVLFSDPISYSDTALFHTGDPPLPEYRTLDDLKGLRVGGIDGYFYREALDKAGLDVQYCLDETSAFKMLLADRFDVVLVNILVGRQIIRDQFPEHADSFKILNGLYSRNELRLIVSRDYPGARELLEAFNAALAETGPLELKLHDTNATGSPELSD